ncbi:MAG: zinc carboxypeptidase, partial [Pseudomonadales bacterium]|nr:zinc carboxypeptidase [Pseudomonadales bacterium]
HLYLNTKEQRKGVYFPLTLEMGSWMWVKKNPRQLFDALGMFNPVMPHRLERVLRRHQTFFEFLLRSARAYQEWMPPEIERRDWMHSAIDHWY